ncbi:hypothetical protein ACFQ1Q_12135 [Winogradskyella litorisediminis]|uniref:Uncharacterized protein n=1 Tax=Winogradskyella litorisediminis TaxID=1156618 RepID=A0ABW3N8Q8_9FLAO
MRISNTKTTIAILFITFLFSTFNLLNAQENELKEFQFLISKEDNLIKLKSLEGSAWLDLSFSKNNYNPQAIDEYGMTYLQKENLKQDKRLADYLITIIKTEDGFELKGVKGTTWTDLKFSLPEGKTQAINQFGMVK